MLYEVITDDGLPLYLSEQFTLLLEQGIGRYQQVEFTQRFNDLFPVFACEELDVDCRGETADLRSYNFV